MAQYIVGREGFTVPATPNPIITLRSAADIVARVNEIFIGGEAVASTVNRMAVRRSTSEGTTPTAQTPAKASNSAPAARASSATAFSGNPTLAAAPALWATALNVFGGIVRWAASPGQELYVSGAATGSMEIGLYGASGTGVVTCQLVFEEI